MIICNPHNPSGRVASRDELLAAAQFAIDNDLIIIADEIHSDLVFSGHRHIPMASLGPEVAARTVTLNSATKSFSIAGLRCAIMHFGAPELLHRFRDVFPGKVLGTASITGIDATIAAWEHGAQWLEAAVAHIQSMRDRLLMTIARDMPMLKVNQPQATYMAWIDCEALKLDEPANMFFEREARIAPSAGQMFDPDAGHFIRVNFATSQVILDTILERMRIAIDRRAASGSGGL